MVGYILHHAVDDNFTSYLLRYGYLANMPIYAIEMQCLKEHYKGGSLVGRRWDGQHMIEEEIRMPDLIDSTGNLFSEKRAEYYESGFLLWLHSQTSVLFQQSLGKRRLAEALIQHGLAEYAIPTWTVHTYSQLQQLLPLIKNAVFKPSGGRQGKGVCKLFINEQGKTIVRSAEGYFPLSESFFEKQLQSNKNENLGNSVLLQPCLDFSLDDTHALDFRLLRHRDINGNWKEVISHARIGDTSLVANVAQGGCIVGITEAVKMIASEGQSEELYDRLMHIGQELPLIIQKMRTNENVYCLGIDVAVDRATLQPYVVEANTYPGFTDAYVYKLAEARVEYYIYYLEKAGIL